MAPSLSREKQSKKANNLCFAKGSVGYNDVMKKERELEPTASRNL